MRSISRSKFDEALPVSQKLNDLAPLNVQDQMTTYRLMRQLKMPPEQIIARADAMVKDHPADPRFEMLRAIAASATDDTDGAKKWLTAAAARTPPDTEFVRMLSSMFDRIGMYDQARAVLEKAAASQKTDTRLNAALIQRMWEAGEYPQVLARLAELLPPGNPADARLLGYKALTLYCIAERAVPPPARRPRRQLYWNQPSSPRNALRRMRSWRRSAGGQMTLPHLPGQRC